MPITEIPEKTLEETEKKLGESYPAILLTQDGFITHANLLATWLWEIPISQLDKLLGVHIVDILSRNLERIKAEEYYGEPYYKKLREIREEFGAEPYHPYVRASHLTPGKYKNINTLKEELHADWQLSEHPWIHRLRIISPDEDSSNELLEFQVLTYQVKSDKKNAGLLVTYEPYPGRTQQIVKRKYDAFKEIEDMIEYVQSQRDRKGGGEKRMSKEHIQEVQPEDSGVTEEGITSQEPQTNAFRKKYKKYMVPAKELDAMLAFAQLEAIRQEFKGVEVQNGETQELEEEDF